jgi:Carboxypeptidase regulatory-like domain
MRFRALIGLLWLGFILANPARASAQLSASISGQVRDESGAAISGAAVAARELETGAQHTVTTDNTGHYRFAALAVGEYKVGVKKDGFQQALRGGLHLAIEQDATVDFTLKVGEIRQQITVTEDAPEVTTTTVDISGIVAEEQIKGLPLNGRSYDELMTLNSGVVNFTSQKTGGVGISNSSVGNMFSVSGNRPQQNLFLLNGVEYTGAAENNMQPGGTSQQLLGIDAVREFNVLRDSYGAQYGKHPGAQVIIVTQSGTNQWHGSLFEFIRNNALDAGNFFDSGDSAPPFQRNQFGASAGGPLRKNRSFLFVNYEGFRQALHQTSATFVPDAASRATAVPAVQPLLNLWPIAPPGSPDFNGIAEVFSSPLQTIREDFGTARLDHVFSEKDSAGAIFTVDDSASITATPLDPFSTDRESLREQVLSLEETHIFSPLLLNTARLGYSRARYFYTGEPTPGTPAAAVPGFVGTNPVGAAVVGGSAASNPQAQIGLAGGNNGSNLHVARNLLTFTDQISWTKGRHQFELGAWLQPFQSNEELALSQFGQMTFASLQNFLGGIGSLLYDPAPTPLSWRSLFGAWYMEDTIHFSPRLVLLLGFRAESSTGWNEANGRASNYIFDNGIIATEPHVGNSLFTTNRAKFLPEPRVAVAWSPFGKATVIRAGFGMYNDLQDALGYRADQNAPFNPAYTIPAGPIANLRLPIQSGAPPPANALLVPGGVQPDMYTPTVAEYSLRFERQLTPNASFSVGYVGSHGYHELIGVDANAPMPVICPAAPCPATFPAGLGALSGTRVPTGTYFIPEGTPKANPALANTWTWFSEGSSSYNALQTDFHYRIRDGFSLRAAYTWSKDLDDGDSLNATAAANAPGLAANPLDVRADWGLATYDVRNLAVITESYALPFWRGRHYLSDPGRSWQYLLAGWTLESIVTAQSGFPFTPQLSYNPSNNGDTRNPVRPFVNPAFTGPIILGRPERWFDPNAFIGPPSGGGFYGNLGRDTLIGPGLATWDFSVVKDTRLAERFDVQFRAEFFNLLNRANFNTPNLITFTPGPTATAAGAASPTAGAVTSTATAARQIQFGLKLLW